MKIWFKIERELMELLEVFNEVLGLENPTTGIEAWWEWIETTENNNGFKYDISRRCKYESGDYDEPVRIVISSSKKEVTESEVIDIAKRLGEAFKVPIFVGEISCDENEKIKYIVKDKFKCA